MRRAKGVHWPTPMFVQLMINVESIALRMKEFVINTKNIV